MYSCLSIYLSVSLSIYLSYSCLSIHMSTSLSVYLSFCLSINQVVYLFYYILIISLSTYLSVNLSISRKWLMAQHFLIWISMIIKTDIPLLFILFEWKSFNGECRVAEGLYQTFVQYVQTYDGKKCKTTT